MLHTSWFVDGKPMTWEQWDLIHQRDSADIEDNVIDQLDTPSFDYTGADWKEAAEGTPMTLDEFDAMLSRGWNGPAR